MAESNKKTKISLLALCLFLVLIFSVPFAFIISQWSAAFAQPLNNIYVQSTSSLQNLMVAYNRELNEKQKYMAYAKRADQEGYLKAAQLFRAAARSEDVHAKLNAKAIVALGGTLQAKMETPLVNSTPENLKNAVKSEEYRSLRMYPKFLEQAKANNSGQAAVSFSLAIKVENVRKGMFREALNKIQDWKTASGGFYVCNGCGNITENVNFKVCPVCGGPASEYAKVT